nr:hypothetical protein [candidate division Zixibacteria bacterium]
MSRLFYVIKKAITNIVRRPLSAFTSLLSLLLLFLMLDMVWISALSVNNYLGQLEEKIDMEIFLDDALPDSAAVYVLDAIRNTDGVAALEYVTKENARDRLLAMMGTDLLDGLGENPLPRSVNLTFDHAHLNSNYLEQLEINFRRLQGVAEIFYPRVWLEKIEYTAGLTFRVSIFLSIAISLAVVLNLLHSIRLSVRTRQQELHQMGFLGAGRFFMSFPYLAEGTFYALVAAAAGWLAIFYGKAYLTFQSFEILLPARDEILLFCLVAAFIGTVCGYLGLRRAL